MKRAVALVLVACTPLPAPVSMDDAGMDVKKDKIDIDTYEPGCDVTMMCSGMMMGATCVVHFETQLVDVNGAPITTEKLFVCGTNLCPPAIPADGQGKISAYECIWFVRGAAKYLGGTRFASFTSLTTMSPNVTFPPLTLVALPAMGADIPMTGTITSNGVSLSTNGATILFDSSEPDDVDLHRFRAVQIPSGKFPPGTPANVEVVYGLGPVNAAIAPKASLTVPNPLNWSQGTMVEFFLNSVDNFDLTPPIPYGDWGSIGMGTVDAQGQIQATSILPMIGMIGLHKI